MKENTNKTNVATKEVKATDISIAFNSMVSDDNLAIIGVNAKRSELFRKLSLDYLSENPLKIKTYLLASEYDFQLATLFDDIQKLRNRKEVIENNLATWKKKSTSII